MAMMDIVIALLGVIAGWAGTAMFYEWEVLPRLKYRDPR